MKTAIFFAVTAASFSLFVHAVFARNRAERERVKDLAAPRVARSNMLRRAAIAIRHLKDV
ncbi:hypothetical protein DB346_02795 [Verrucomicrobia bacterium LW23]|nr:hypothetical protein DB346_03860 [Verrucomicrobia bacterium LW23]PTY04376.1 hypothetical protein DB346_02795 [Verrucomicrobia bacterium LW23]